MGLRDLRGRLAFRLTASFLLPTAVCLVAIGVLADHVAQRMLEDQLAERLIAIAHAERTVLGGIFADQIRRVDAHDSRALESLRRRIQPIADETGVRRVFVFTADAGSSVVDTDDSVPFGHHYYELEADASELEAVRAGESRASVMYTASDGTPYKYAYAPLLDEETGALVAIIGVEGSSTQLAALQAFRRNLIWLGLIALVLVLAVAMVVSRHLTATVDGLAHAAERIGAGRLETPVARTRTDELGELERSLEAMRRALQSRDEEMQMMLTGIAHEVRNPLGGIELFLGLLDEDLAAELREGDPRRAHLARIGRELDYLARVVNEFLDFARRRPMDVSRFEARAFLDELAQLMQGDVLAAGVAMAVSVEAGLELTADRDRLRRVVVNLIRNACQASSEGCCVRVEARATATGSRLLQVVDTGAGIPEHKLADIFRPFFTTREKGTGLGLPLARKVVEAHGGTVTVASTVGEGTTVTLELPFDATRSRAEQGAIDIPEGWLG